QAVLDTGIILKAPLQMRNAKGKFYEQETIIEQLKIQENFLKDQIKIEVKNAYYSLKASYQQFDLAKKELKLALELEKSEKDKFELGDSNILFINIREQATADARIREVTSKINYNTAIFDYKASLSEL
ncbi:MAG: TolC family protein, partial [Candidatus Sericytochromatia bacterium]